MKIREIQLKAREARAQMVANNERDKATHDEPSKPDDPGSSKKAAKKDGS